MVDKNIITELTQLQKQKLAYYQELLDLTKQQEEVIEAEDFQQLNQLLAQKGKIIKKIDQLDTTVEPYKEQLIAEFDLDEENWLTEFVQQQNDLQLQKIVNQLLEILEKLSQLGEESQEVLQEKYEQVQKELKGVRQGSQLNKSYGGQQQQRIHSTYIDQKS